MAFLLFLAPRPVSEHPLVLRTATDPDALIQTIALALTPPVPSGAFSREPETLGLITLLLEADLGDLRGVVPHIGDRPPSPGLAGAAPLTAERWPGTIEVSGTPEALRIALVLCPPDEPCSTDAAIGTQADPAPAVARVVQATAVRLQRGRVGPPRANRRSEDAYAQLITGRAAAVGYGLLPPTPPEALGNNRRDPAARAPFLDPTIPEAWWELGRQTEAPALAALAFARAAELEPGSTLRLADQAATTAACTAAWSAWQEVEARAAREARFTIPRARAALCARDLSGAAETLALIEQPDIAEVDMLRVQLAEAVGPGDDYDTLLTRWQGSDPGNPEPIRRRIRLRIRQGDYADALSLAPGLAERGAGPEAEALQLALAANIGQLDTAAAAADALGRVEDGWRLRAASGDPPPLPPLASLQPADLAGRGWRLLAGGDARGALAAAEAALAVSPWLPEALALQVGALEALGRTEDATAARARLRRADPASAG